MCHTFIRPKLRTYTGELLKILGQVNVQVKYHGQEEQLPLLVVRGKGPSLLDDQDTFGLGTTGTQNSETSLNWRPCCKSIYQCSKMAEKFTVKIHVDPEAEPRIRKTRPVPYSQRSKPHTEIDRLNKKAS